MCPAFYQIDVHLRMSKSRFGATVTEHNSRRAHGDGRFIDHLDGPVRINHLGGIDETGIPVVLIVVELWSESRTYKIINSLLSLGLIPQSLLA